MLEFRIKAGEIDLTPETEAYIRERAEHLDAFYDLILTCRVIVEAPVHHHRKGGPFEVRIDLDVPGGVVAVTRQEADDLHVAIRKAFDAAERRLEDYAQKRQEEQRQVKTEAGPPEARVIKLFPDEGYGFLEAPDGHEIYFHRNSVLGDDFPRLKIGEVVRFIEEEGDKGPQATTVSSLGA